MAVSRSHIVSAHLGGFLMGLLQVILYPRRGWEDAALDGYNARDLLVRGLVPLLAVVAFSSLCDAFYYASVSYVQAVIGGVIDFTGYFVSVYLCNFLFTWALKQWVFPMRFNANNVMTLVIYAVAAMSLMTLCNNVFPADLALLSFLPFYVIYILWGATDYMSVPEGRKPHFLAVALLTVFIPPYLLTYCLSLLI